MSAAMEAGQRLHVKTGQAAACAGLLPWAAVNARLSAQALMEGEVSVMRAGREVPLEMLTRLVGGQRVLLDAQLQTLCQGGASLVLLGMHRHVQALAALAAMVERHVEAPVTINAYASFTRDGAFQIHRDGHDVLVVQIAGSKRWFCHGRRSDPPFGGETVDPRRDPGPPEAEMVLEPGDLLFVPKGDYHRAEVADAGGQSLHLTVAIQRPDGAEVLRWRLREMADRLAAPVPMDPSAMGAYEAQLKAVLADLCAGLDLDRFRAAQAAARPLAGAMALGLATGADGPEDAVLVQPALRRRPVLPATGPADIRAGGVTTHLNAQECAILALLLDRDIATTGEILAGLPSEDPAALRAAVAALARRGLVFLTAS
ncbi:JmjC domain-containing protein [Tistrella mobilis]|uniref:JmjC domain-containing protein n=1 Tax=Tistrella mobilis TaxID=171437 RepID=UPI0002D8DA30|nr:cupin domain-containing protein [Tistrella mobilis]